MAELKRETEPPETARARGGLAWIAYGFAVVFALVAVALPALLAGGLVVSGVQGGSPSWIVLGGLTGALWSAMCFGTIARGRGGEATPPRSDGPPAPSRQND